MTHIAPLDVYPKETKIHIHIKTRTPISTAASLTIVKKRKQPKCPSTGERINILWSIHIIEWYPATERNEALTHVTTWMNLKNTTLSERSQTQKAMQCVIPFTRSVRTGKSTDREWLHGCQGLGEGNVETNCK